MAGTTKCRAARLKFRDFESTTPPFLSGDSAVPHLRQRPTFSLLISAHLGHLIVFIRYCLSTISNRHSIRPLKPGRSSPRDSCLVPEPAVWLGVESVGDLSERCLLQRRKAIPHVCQRAVVCRNIAVSPDVKIGIGCSKYGLAAAIE